MAAAARISSVNSWFDRFESALMTGTSRGRSARSPFDFGVITANHFAPKRQVRPTAPSASSTLSNDIAFTITEARERIREFIDGSYKPRQLGDLIGYLGGRMLRLETLRFRNGQSANYLVDAKTLRSVPAAAVDRRLSRPGIARTYQSTLEAEAARLVQAQTPEQKLAHSLRNDNAGRLLAADIDSKPFRDWDDMSFSAPSMFRGREFSAQGRDIWVGVVYERASDNPSENLALLAKARAEGKKLILPALTREDALAGRFTPGMPILLRQGAVRTRFIDPALSYSRLTEIFGSTPHDHFRARNEQFSPRVRDAEVVSLDAFREQFRRRAPAVAAAVSPATTVPARKVQIETSRPTYTIRHEVLDTGEEQLTMIDAKTGVVRPFDPALAGAGRYRKEDAFGLPAGELVVGVDGGYAHLVDGRYHNTLGPAIVAAKGSGQQDRYAINGEFVPKGRFGTARTEAYALTPPSPIEQAKLERSAAPAPADERNSDEYRSAYR